MIDKNFLKETATQLNDLANLVEQVDFDEKKEISINFDSINADKANKVCDELSTWGKKNKESRYIYIIQANNKTDIDKCYQQYEIAKTNKVGSRAYARLNKPSSVFYVGSSSSLGTRIKQHLGFGPQGTFALQSTYWSKEISGKLNITIWRFSKQTSQAVIQAVEDGLWEKYKPMFGRRGAR
ncbi:MAG TPA: GIY-YIG nuclease family protein [Nitrospinota bacterium]|nr:GIY-YIG nuclease family protein [Nitrospinota bacterium]